jgi:hypothetical protein
MKRFFTLFTGIILSIASTAQFVLNELYTDPGAGKHEFFELYNNSSSSLPMSLAGYSVITYFEGAGTEKGFYVLDLPDLQVASKGYFVGSSAKPFNHQGVSGSTKTQFSWNDIVFLNLNNGYLKKWVVGTTVPASIDGNASYDEKPVPLNFNEFFYRRTGSGASYTVFVYKNGNLVNAFFGGSSSQTVPAYITSMPRLRVKLAGVPNEANINFNNISSSAAEYVIADAGSDNGFIRHRDGLCAAWGKSSAGVQHTPCETNGSIFEALGSVSILSGVVRGTNPSEFSLLSYKLVSAAPEALPLVLDVYIDNGTNMTVLDSKDTYLDSDTIMSVSDSIYKHRFKPYDANILIAVKEAPGCYGKVFAAVNLTLLQANLLELKGSVENTAVKLQWNVNDNENGNVFEVQKSADGSNFKSVGFLFASEKKGTEEYFFKGIYQVEATAFYRLKIKGNDNSSSYSKVIQLSKLETGPAKAIRLLKNPVDSYLGFTYQPEPNIPSEVSIYAMSGTKLYSTKLSTNGVSTFTLNLGGRITAGIYLLEIRSGAERKVIKFIKR